MVRANSIQPPVSLKESADSSLAQGFYRGYLLEVALAIDEGAVVAALPDTKHASRLGIESSSRYPRMIELLRQVTLFARRELEYPDELAIGRVRMDRLVHYCGVIGDVSLRNDVELYEAVPGLRRVPNPLLIAGNLRNLYPKVNKRNLPGYRYLIGHSDSAVA